MKNTVGASTKNPAALFSFSHLESEENFKNFMLVSLLLHLSFILIIPLKNLLLPNKILNLSNAIRVDVVALPEKMAEEIPKTSLPLEKPIAANKTPVDVKNKKMTQAKEDQQKAIEKLKALQAIEKIKQEVSSTRPQESKPTISQPYKGQIISSGNSFTGLSRLRVNDYLENLTHQIRDHWELPQWLSSVSLKAVVVVSVDARGYAIKNEIYTSSGNTVFDASCLAAVKASLPLAPPPDEVREALLLIRFPFE